MRATNRRGVRVIAVLPASEWFRARTNDVNFRALAEKPTTSIDAELTSKFLDWPQLRALPGEMLKSADSTTSRRAVLLRNTSVLLGTTDLQSVASHNDQRTTSPSYLCSSFIVPARPVRNSSENSTDLLPSEPAVIVPLDDQLLTPPVPPF